MFVQQYRIGGHCKGEMPVMDGHLLDIVHHFFHKGHVQQWFAAVEAYIDVAVGGDVTVGVPVVGQIVQQLAGVLEGEILVLPLVVVVVKLAVAAVFALQVARIRHLKSEQRKVRQGVTDMVGGERGCHC